MAVIRSHIPDASLLLTLESSYEKNDRFMRFSTSIAERAAKAGVREAIVWLGELSGCEVTYVLSQADLLVFPSLAESFGLPLVEAMVAGCPIAASDLPYAREVTAGVGVFFDPKVPSEIARAAIEILRNVDLAKDLARRGIERASHFSGGGIADRICAVIETVQARWHHGLDRHYRNV
jgi:glycosyltransferase involved in cell wall biosynthesis